LRRRSPYLRASATARGPGHLRCMPEWRSQPRTQTNVGPEQASPECWAVPRRKDIADSGSDHVRPCILPLFCFRRSYERSGRFPASDARRFAVARIHHMRPDPARVQFGARRRILELPLKSTFMASRFKAIVHQAFPFERWRLARLQARRRTGETARQLEEVRVDGS